MQPTKKTTLTILAPAARLSPEMLAFVANLVREEGLGIYLTTTQNLRLLDVPEVRLEEIRQRLAAAGAACKSPGIFPKPKICVGAPYCNLGLVETEPLSRRLLERFGQESGVKPKLKIAVAACPASCANALLCDIGVVATRNGYRLYAGGKGGARPQIGRLVAKNLTEDGLLDAIGRLFAFHQRQTEKKQRMYKLLDDPDFPLAARPE